MNDQQPPQPDARVVSSGQPCLPADAPQERAAWRSDEILGGRTEVLILHNNEVYRLRRTRQGKLILQK